MSAGMKLRDLKGRALKGVRAFAAASRGNVAMIFALTLIPLCFAVGAGLDYARAVVVRSNMSEAIDAAALAVGSTKGLTNAQMQTLAQQYFNANYKADSSYGTPAAITVVPSGQSVTITASNQMPTTLLSAVGINSLAISVSTRVVWGQIKLWVALVLDNTGSMCEPDNQPCDNDTNPNIKMNALKTATKSLLAMLQNASASPGDVQVAIVPFSKDVNLGTSYYNAWWLDWSDWDSHNNHQSCTGWGWNQHCTTVPDNHNTWNGCLTDRDQNFDVNTTTPTSSNAHTDFIPEEYSYCPQALTPLGYDWTALNSEVDAMYASGSTNQTIGLVWGWQTMEQGLPLNPPALPANTNRIIILLSDGLNTQNRWDGDGAHHSSSVDNRMAQACNNAKADGIIIYSVFVDLNGTQGNSDVLEACASDDSKYFDLTTSGAIISTFNQIGQQITNLRVAQ
jgi:Flp pilus assembly protein TadG